MQPLLPYIEARLRRPVPAELSVIRGSTPVLAFGRASTARVATLGLNPSRVEFLDAAGAELTGSARRLATHASLEIAELSSAPATVLRQVVDDCDSYFDRNPYRRWFDQLERILKACDASYYDGSACHLDLVQWATDPTWGRLDARCQARLLADDAPYLAEQLRAEPLRVLLVNGTAVVRTLRRALDVRFRELEPIVDESKTTRLYAATLFATVHVIGWSTNIQSSFGVTTERRTVLAARVGAALRNRLR